MTFEGWYCGSSSGRENINDITGRNIVIKF